MTDQEHDGNLDRAREELKKSLDAADVVEGSQHAQHAIAFALICLACCLQDIRQTLKDAKIEISPPQP